MQFIKFFLAAAFAVGASAHMEMISPAPFRSSKNPNAKSSTIDYSMTSPLSGAAQFPCKGYTSDFSDLTGVGKPTATWPQGSSQSITISGGASHNGGSCQLAMSYDSGKTFKVVHSFIGSCPLSSSYSFVVPSDAPTGNAIFAWIWYNHTGNREIYMNCASVAVTAGSGTSSSVAFSARPEMFKANLGNGCTTVEGADVVYPDPGPDVTTSTQNKAGDTGLSGSCGAASGGGSTSAGAPTSTSVATPTKSSSTPVVSIPVIPSTTTSAAGVSATPSPSGGVFVTVPTGTGTTATSTAVASGGGATPTGGASSGSNLTVSADGTCGGTKKCPTGFCCSSDGFCGTGDAWCGSKCQTAFGTCGSGASGKLIRGRMVFPYAA
jgi:hypothetical protein